MAILTKEQFFDKIKTLVGEKSDDETLTLIEDFTDTYNSFSENSNAGEIEKLKNQLAETEKNWREKYRARFFEKTDNTDTDTNTNTNDNTDTNTDTDTSAEDITINDLFKE